MSRMMTTCAAAIAAIAILTGTNPAGAHHSGLAYESKPIWIRGTVLSFEIANPHSIITLEETAADGQTRRYAVEGPARFQLERMGIGADSPKPGDSIQFCAFPYKSVEELARIWPETDFSSRRSAVSGEGSTPRLIEGHVMVLPEGAMRYWDPHGLLIECMRFPDKPKQAWLDWLNADPLARQGWCEQRGREAIRSDASLQALMDEIDGLIGNPCE